jgi:hypothetical protein
LIVGWQFYREYSRSFQLVTKHEHCYNNYMMVDDFQPSGQRAKLRKSAPKDKENFQTPEEVAADDTVERPAAVPDEFDTQNDSEPVPRPSKNQSSHEARNRFALHWPPGKKEWAVAIVVLLLVGCSTALALRHSPTHSAILITKGHPLIRAKAPVIVSRLTGLPVTAAQAALPVTGVMIENSDDARPQSGLSQAGVVFEALAEGGITRFLAIYEEGQPTSIGPIRSARPYFIDWLLPFDAGYAHVGGSPAALSEITADNVRDMNQFSYGSTYTRISSRAAPHNVYTSMANLNALEQSKGWGTSNFVGFPRKSDQPSKTPTATAININPDGPDMDVQYQYNPKLDSYARSEAGAPMIDANTGQQLEPKVVIAMLVPWVDGPLDSSGAYYTQYSDIGTSTAYIFQDGIMTQGVWVKSSPSSQLEFKTAAGATLKLNAGQTWITAIGSASQVTST